MNYDVFENRLLKHFLKNILVQKISHIMKTAYNEIETMNENKHHYEDEDVEKVKKLREVVTKCREYRKRIRQYLRKYEFLSSVGRLRTSKSSSLVLQRERNYREFYRRYLDFMKNRILIFDSSDFYLRIKDIHELYEMWCTLKVISRLRKMGFEISKENVFDVEDVKFTFRMTSGSTPLLVLRRNGDKICVFYKKQYTPESIESVGYGSWGPIQIPDISIELFSKGAETPSILIFDAKYRKFSVDIMNQLGAECHYIKDRARKSIVEGAYALWTDQDRPYRGNTGGILFIPTAEESEKFYQKTERFCQKTERISSFP